MEWFINAGETFQKNCVCFYNYDLLVAVTT